MKTFYSKKIVYETQWVQTDFEKKYPHGWGFIPMLVEFPQDADPAWCAEMCRRHLTTEEFECIGAAPRPLVVGIGPGVVDYPKNREEYGEWEKANPLTKE